MKKKLLQAYKQAPWRVQLQWIGLFLLGLVLVASTAGVYLNISAQAATSGRNIQSLERKMTHIQNEIADLTADLAATKSSDLMIARAEQLGFKRIDPFDAVYLVLPGYIPTTDFVLAPPRINTLVESPMVRNSYKSSLWDWFVDQIWLPSPEALSEGGLTP